MILKTKPPISNFEKFTHTEQQFLSIAQPLITRHLDNLLSEVRNKYAHFMETTLLKTLYLSLIADKTLLLVSRAAVLELNLACQLSELSGKTPQERFDSFFNHFENDAFFQQYPVLNRFLETILLDFYHYLLEIFNNYAAEWQSLFLDETITPKIIDIETDLKDIYEKGRSVALDLMNAV